MSRYFLTAEAQHDLKEIRDYVLDEGGFSVARYVVGARQRISRGCQNARPGTPAERPHLP